ncbi:MAG: xanthine dehydrogenase molybdopterin binding subunit [Pseudomonadota bacterium]
MTTKATPRSDVHGSVGSAVAHDSAELHVAGAAMYTDDVPEPRGTGYAAIGVSSHAHARVVAIDLEPVLALDGVIGVITASDIPGENNYGTVVKDDPILADGVVEYVGQPLFAVAAKSVAIARRAARLAKVDYKPLEPILTIRDAVERGASVLPSVTLARGNARAAIDRAAHRLKGRTHVGGQDQFYLEGQIALASPREGGDMWLLCSTQHPGHVQELVAECLGLTAKDVVVECRRMGGAFGGKESQPALIGCIAALLARRFARPIKLRLDRDADMIITGKRHDFDIDYDVGFDSDGRIDGIEFTLASRCGMSADLSGAINDRALFHADNGYFLEHATLHSHRCKTNTVSNTAFRGFGGPQGMFAIEHVVDEIARYLDLDPLAVRRNNLYGTDTRNETPYGQVVEDNILEPLIAELETSSAYRQRRQAISDWNASSPILKRGIALTPVKFGISFTATHLNQAGALIHIYADGSVQLNHGGTEMGQGLFTKVAQVVAEELQIDIDRIRVTASDTSKVPNASATAASSGSDLNGKAAEVAARTLRMRLTEFAALHYGVAESEVHFERNTVRIGEQSIAFEQLVDKAYRARVSLSATGFYKTPKIRYDRETLSGRPFYYYAYGAAVSEVIVDTLTGEHRVVRVDILHDCGDSLNPAIDLGQIEGGFVQGMGWLTTEQLWWNEAGELKTHAPSTYKIPTSVDVPHDFRVQFFSGSNREDTIYRSKAVGEPPLMLALSVFHAIRDAIDHATPNRGPIELLAPATPEAVLRALHQQQRLAAPTTRTWKTG